MKERGVARYTDKATGRPVIDVPKEMLAAHYGLPQPSKTAARAKSRWEQLAMNAGKGDMPRPRTPEQKAAADETWLNAFCLFHTKGDENCRCFECQKRV